MYRRLVVVAILGCRGQTPNASAPAVETPRAAAAAAEDVTAFEAGKTRPRTPAMTEIDLRDDWTPTLFGVQPDGTAPAFRATYLAEAHEKSVDGKALPPNLGLAELYGIVPSFAIVRDRFRQTARYQCRAGVDSAPLAKLARPYGEELSSNIKINNRQRAYLGGILERARVQRGLADYAPFEKDKELADTYAQWKTTDELYQGVVAAQRHLVCEGLLTEKDVDGEFTWVLGQALEQFQRRNFLVPNARLDPDTRAALATDPRELDYRGALRILRERVVDATGLIEDGTAGAGPTPVMGRQLEPVAMRSVHGRDKPLANGAPDLVDAATDAAARALGWTDPAATAAFLASHPGGLRAAIELPARPSYYSKHMDVFAEIDRGDVWYDEQPIPRVAWVRPALVLYVRDGATKRPLIRWPTTIGGWADVREGGVLKKLWKESDVGPREWRQLYAAPTWLPPDATPDDELVRWVAKGKWELKTTIMGPGPLSAFGLMRLPHERPVKTKAGVQWIDNGIGTHGSAVVTSLLNGTSHGCHRLYNHLAVRLAGFLLDHRDHVVKGEQPEHYRRTVSVGKNMLAKVDTRGFLYELTPPVHIDVLPGNIRSQRKVPPAASAPAGAD